MNFRNVLSAVDPTLRGAQELAHLIGEPLRPLSLRRLLNRALAWRMQHQSLIRHVFVLMLENRSFDHVFGYSGISGTDSKTGGMTEVDGLIHRDGTNIIDPNTGETIHTSQDAPFDLRGIARDVEHEFLDVMEQMCGRAAVPMDGRLNNGVYPRANNSGFVSNFMRRQPMSADTPNWSPATPMRCFAPANLPVLNALALEFAICDYWFASHPGPTWPNRFFVHAASPSDEGQADSPPDVDIGLAVAGVNPYHFRNGTIYDALAENGLRHRVYSGNDCPQVRGIRARDILLDSVPGQLAQVAGPNLVSLRALQPDLQDPNYAVSYVFIEPDNGEPDHVFAGVGVRCNSVRQNDMHPPSDVRDGEALIKQVYETIRNSPVWNQSALVILFDEHGGFFDHVADEARQQAVRPGDGAVDQTHNFQFDHLGVRVPAIVVSPWVGRNVVDHTTYDHTSVLATVEKLFGLHTLTDRDAAANDLLELFSQITPRTDARETLPSPAW